MTTLQEYHHIFNPLVTRSSIWTEAAVCKFDNYHPFYDVINVLNGHDAISIEMLQNLLHESTIEGYIAFNKMHFRGGAHRVGRTYLYTRTWPSLLF